MELQPHMRLAKNLEASFSEVEQRVREELAKEGFDILSEINVKNKLRDGFDKDFREYIILGACNAATLAWEAFGKVINIGSLLPCNVVILRDDEANTVVMVMDPVAALDVIGNVELNEIAGQVRARMANVLAAL